MWYSHWGHQQSFAFCSARWVRSCDLLDVSTSLDFHFWQFLSSTTLTTQNVATVGNHDGTRGREPQKWRWGGAGGCTGQAYKVHSLFILIFSTKLTLPPFPAPTFSPPWKTRRRATPSLPPNLSPSHQHVPNTPLPCPDDKTLHALGP